MPQISRGENICYLNYIINFRINQGGVFIPEARPGYYAVIPAEVRYDDRIQANAKLLYGEISALLNAEGYCFASNGYFAELYGVTERTISGLISKLQKCGYLQIEIRRDESGQVVSRRIRLAPSITDGHPVEKIFHTPRKDFQEGIENNFQYTNPSNTDIYKENKKESSAEGEGSPPKEEQKKKRQTTKLAQDEIQKLFVAWIRQISEGWTDTQRNSLFRAVCLFLKSREDSGKPMQSQPSVTALCNKLMRFSGGQLPVMIDMLETATACGWRSVYAPKSKPPVIPPKPMEDKRWL